MYKHVIFDFDGTLVDSEGAIVEIYNDLAGKYHFNRLSPEEYKRLNNLPLKEKMKMMGIPFHRLFFTGKFGKDFSEKYKKYLPSLRFFDGMEELLQRLKTSGYTLSIITSNAADNISDFLKARRLDIIDNIHSSRGILGKSRTLNQYLKRHRLDQKEVIYVGDEQRDVLACRKSNVDIISVTWGLDSRELLVSANPEYMADEHTQIMEILSRCKK